MNTQHIIDEAVKIATKQALYGTPVSRVIYIPPTSATQVEGSYCVIPYDNMSATATRPWDK
jgi:hypothetical protein